jgi:hypothetical protein
VEMRRLLEPVGARSSNPACTAPAAQTTHPTRDCCLLYQTPVELSLRVCKSAAPMEDVSLACRRRAVSRSGAHVMYKLACRDVVRMKWPVATWSDLPQATPSPTIVINCSSPESIGPPTAPPCLSFDLPPSALRR